MRFSVDGKVISIKIKTNKVVDWQEKILGNGAMGSVEMTHLGLFEDISGNGVEVSQVFDGRDVLGDGLDHHLAGRQHQLMGSHLMKQRYSTHLSHTYMRFLYY